MTLFRPTVVCVLLLLSACAPAEVASSRVVIPASAAGDREIPPGFRTADGSLALEFPRDFGAHPDYRTEWWYYTGNLADPEGRPFGFELTIFRVGLLPPAADLPAGSAWYGRSLYFAHFAISDIAADRFHAYERYSRPGPGLAGAEADPYRVWLEDWGIAGQAPGVYRLQAAQGETALDLTLTDELGVVLHGEDGYSRKGEGASNASYYYSQPRLRAEGVVQTEGIRYAVKGLAWKDHEFSTGLLDEIQTGWDWFSLQFEGGEALMLFQLRERDGTTSAASSGTFIEAGGGTRTLGKADFEITVLDEWRSPHTGGVYPAGWQVRLARPDCQLDVQPWMADQEIHFPVFTYWEGAVRFEGRCDGTPVRGSGYIELTGYAGQLPVP